MKFITSISPRRIDRQQHCILSWLEYGEVIAIQTEDEIYSLQYMFPDVQFIATKRTGEELYGYPSRVNIAAMIKHGPGLLINSDIELETTSLQFNIDWEQKRNQFNVGIRYDYDGHESLRYLCKYGIDAFLITEEVMVVMEDHGFVIGVPVWDYWIIWHMITCGFKIKTKRSPGLLHLNHPMGWPDSDMEKGFNIVLQDYGIGEEGLSMAIGDITKRLHIKHGKHNTSYDHINFHQNI